ncbi:xylose isomerase-like protein [Phakopsora pachyrhizi]|nr:xylose isomerase-like protein [Phakopsora pachyrhizi]
MYNNYSTNLKFSIFSHSLGDHSSHDLLSKISAAALAGLRGVEISTIDLEDHSSKNSISLSEAAQQVSDHCKLLNLKVVCLQPVRDVVEAKTTQEALDGTIHWFHIMDILETDLMICCSSSLEPDMISSRFSDSVRNLRAIGIEASRFNRDDDHDGLFNLRISRTPRRICFEALCWGTFINTWSQAWDIVKAVDLENVGLCLDSFNTLAREWADPTVDGGIQPGADLRISNSLEKLSKTIADGKKLKEPIPKGSFKTPALMTWSRSSRLFPMEFERGGYLPIQKFIRSVVMTGYDGYWSAEVFNKSLSDPNPNVPPNHAIRAIEGLIRLRSSIDKKKLFLSSRRSKSYQSFKSKNINQSIPSNFGLLPIS